MGLFSIVKDVVTVVKSGASAVADGVGAGVNLIEGKPDVALAKVQKFAADSSAFLQGAAKLGADVAPWAEKFIDNPFVKTAKSPILAAAQGLILGMHATTGSGTPETGDALKESAKLFDEALEIYLDAQPKSDRWDGTAAEEYGHRDHDQKDRASLMLGADDGMRDALMTEAGQVGATRDTLDEWSRYLYDFGLATFAIGLLGPYGRAAQLVLDAGAAATALGVTGNSMWNLASDASDNAAKIRAQSDNYRKANQEVSKGLACTPFGEERSKLPTRLDPPIPNQVPAPEEVPQYGPPATPLGGPTTSTPAPVGAVPANGAFASAIVASAIVTSAIVTSGAVTSGPRFSPAASGAPGASLATATTSAPFRATASPPPTVGAQPARTGERAPIEHQAPATPEEVSPQPVPAR